MYFEPYLEAGEIAICEWNQSAEALTMSDVVPELRELIKGKSSWRAVVVDHPRGEVNPPRHARRDSENPFDFLDNTSANLNLEDSKHPLIRLSHVLLGYPQMTVKYFRPYIQFEDSATGEVRSFDARAIARVSPSDLADRLGIRLDIDSVQVTPESLFGLVGNALSHAHNNVRRVFHEEHYSDEERALHADLVDRYRMKEVRPSEVLFVATRTEREEDEQVALRRAWASDGAEGPSRFVERNDYPPMSRFAVYEMLEPENSGYRRDLLRFWLSILTIARNQVPSSAFQADQLYELSVEFESAGLGSMLNAHISQLAMVRDHLDRVISAPIQRPDLEVSDLLVPAETQVEFDDVGGDELKASKSGYGLSRDKPRDERRRWKAEMTQISSAARLFMRKPRRVVGRAVHGARNLYAQVEPEPVTLDDFQRDELEDALASRLRDIVLPTTAELLDEERLQRVIDQGDQDVSTLISQRMDSSTIWAAMGITLGAWAAILLPYILLSFQGGFAAIADSILVAFVILGVVAASGYFVLAGLRRRLIYRIRKFNRSVEMEMLEVKSSAAEFGDYLSGFVTYRRAAERLRSANLAQDIRAERVGRLRRLRSRVVAQIAEEKEIVRSLGVPLEIQRLSAGLIDLDLEDERVERLIFRLPEGDAKIPFNNSGEILTAPYDFITRVDLWKLSIHEDVHHNQEDLPELDGEVTAS